MSTCFRGKRRGGEEMSLILHLHTSYKFSDKQQQKKRKPIDCFIFTLIKEFTICGKLTQNLLEKFLRSFNTFANIFATYSTVHLWKLKENING